MITKADIVPAMSQTVLPLSQKCLGIFKNCWHHEFWSKSFSLVDTDSCSDSKALSFSLKVL